MSDSRRAPSGSMSGMTSGDTLALAAQHLIRDRFGDVAWSGAAALKLEDGTVLTSTAPDVPNEAVSLCHETGALCEAFKLNKVVTDSICIVQPSPNVFRVLSPCGVCQERLFIYGPHVRVGVPAPEGGWAYVELSEVQPHYWRLGLPPD